MYKAEILLVSAHAEKLFNLFLLFYPEQYRKKYGHEMLLLFQDMYQEELTKKGDISLTFWFSQFVDITKSVIEQHIDMIQRQGMKKYLQQTLHVNSYNIISVIFLLPVILMTCVEVISRITQGDLTHYNRPVYAFFSHTFLYWTPVLYTWVILFPLLAAVISFIPIVKSFLKRKTGLSSLKFILPNIIGIAISLFGLGFIALIRLHDFVPCTIHGLTNLGFEKLNYILSVCRNA